MGSLLSVVIPWGAGRWCRAVGGYSHLADRELRERSERVESPSRCFGSWASDFCLTAFWELAVVLKSAVESDLEDALVLLFANENLTNFIDTSCNQIVKHKWSIDWGWNHSSHTQDCLRGNICTWQQNRQAEEGSLTLGAAFTFSKSLIVSLRICTGPKEAWKVAWPRANNSYWSGCEMSAVSNEASALNLPPPSPFIFTEKPL